MRKHEIRIRGRQPRPTTSDGQAVLRLVGRSAWRGLFRLYNSDGLTHAASVAYTRSVRSSFLL
ncbi:MAG: hypothetical protein R2712_07355 [Vicinamibacterales bacterium]